MNIMKHASGLVVITLLLVTSSDAQQIDTTRPLCTDTVIIPGEVNTCPPTDLLDSARDNITTQALLALACGGVGWRQVADLDMTNPSQQCPSPWVEEDSTPARSCTSSITTAGCEGVSFPVSGGTYSRVCGRAVGYANSTVDAFAEIIGLSNGSIENPYVDGMSITHGSPRQHIWSLAAGHGLRVYATAINSFRCPCDNFDHVFAPLPPPFVGDNYFCDGDYNGALWDAKDCTTACCTFHSPPYFSVSLPTPTSDAIEVRICTDQEMINEAVYISMLKLFVR